MGLHSSRCGRLRPRTALGAGIALVAVAAIGAGVARTHAAARDASTPRVEMSAASSSSSLVGVAPEGARLASRRSPGRIDAYDVSLDEELFLDPRAMFSAFAKEGRLEASGAATRATHTTGRMEEIALYGADDGGTVDLLVLSAPHVTTPADGSGGSRASIEAALAQGIVVQRDARGRVVQARLPRGAGGDAASALASLVTVMQLTGPSDPAARAWSSDEPATVGSLHVRYESASPGERAAGADPEIWHRRVDGVAPRAAETRAPGLRSRSEISGEGRLTMDHGGVVPAAVALQIKATTRNAMTDEVFARASVRAAATRVATTTDLARAATIFAALDVSFGPWSALDARPSEDPAARDAALASQVGEHGLADVLSWLRCAGHDAEARDALAKVLVPFLRLHPEASSDIGRAVGAMALSDDGARAALTGLAQAGHAPAQEAIVLASRAFGRPEDRVTAVALLGSLPAQTLDTEAYLRALRDDARAPDTLQGVADYALAKVAAHVRDSEPARADVIVDEYVDRLKSAAGPDALARSIGALGNTSSARIADVIPPFVTNEDPGVRRMVVYALSRVPEGEARATLERIATEDPDEGVRAEAAKALSPRGT